MDLLTVLRFVNVALAWIVGAHLIVTALSSKRAPAWSRARVAPRLLRLGSGAVLLVLGYGTTNAMVDGVPPSETTWLLTIALLWLAVGTGWTIFDALKARRPARAGTADTLPPC